MECERYLISIGDEKISEGTIQDNPSASHGFPDHNNASCHGANNGPATRSNLRSALGKRKRDIQVRIFLYQSFYAFDMKNEVQQFQAIYLFTDPVYRQQPIFE